MNISRHTPFKERRMEWWFACVSVGLGLWLLLPNVSMSTPAFNGLTNWLNEDQWGAVFALTGAAHLVSLFINGRRWWTPFVRTATLVVNSLCYAWFAAGFFIEYWPTTATFTYGGAMCSSALICIYYAVKDCVHALEIRRGIC